MASLAREPSLALPEDSPRQFGRGWGAQAGSNGALVKMAGLFNVASLARVERGMCQGERARIAGLRVCFGLLQRLAHGLQWLGSTRWCPMTRLSCLLLGVTMVASMAGCYASVEPEHPHRHVRHDVVVRERVVYHERDHRHYR